jgi:hypothetical protein
MGGKPATNRLSYGTALPVRAVMAVQLVSTFHVIMLLYFYFLNKLEINFSDLTPFVNRRCDLFRSNLNFS